MMNRIVGTSSENLVEHTNIVSDTQRTSELWFSSKITLRVLLSFRTHFSRTYFALISLQFN